MRVYDLTKRVLRTTGLLPWARAGRAWARRVQYLPENLTYWRGKRESLPVPPLALIDLVSGQPDIGWFLQGGRRGAAAVREVLGRHDVAMDSLSAILDFGCGCGRVTRHWSELAGRVRVHGSDLNPRLVAWCRANLTFADFETNALAPPLPFNKEGFDLVYAFSVFTHLPESLQRTWIEELHRVLTPGGLLVISTHGARYADELTPEQRKRFEDGRLVVTAAEDAGSNACGAYHPEAYVHDTLATGFDVVDFLPEGATGNPHQDLWLMKKR